MSKKIKILQFITLSEIGGAQMVLYNIVKNLPDFFDITVVCSKGGELVDLLKKLNKPFKIIELENLQRNLSLSKDFKVYKQIKELLKKENFDIIHCHSSKAGVLGRIAGTLAKTPKVIFTSHGLSFNNQQDFISRNIYKIIEFVCGKFCTKIVCVSEYDLKKLANLVDAKKICLINNGVEVCRDIKEKSNQTKKNLHPVLKLIKYLAPQSKVDCQIIKGNIFTGNDKEFREEGMGNSENFVGETSRFRLQNFRSRDINRLKILMVGRLAEPKLPELLIECFKKIQKLNAELAIIGNGPKMQVCQDLVNKYSMENVKLKGTILNLTDEYLNSDIFVLLSRFEGLPMSILEAMSAGKPVLASNVGGIPELIKDDFSGFLVENDLNKVIEKLMILLKNANLRKKMGERGQQIFKENFTVKKMVKEYLKIYVE